LKALHSIQNPFYRRLSKYDSGQIKIKSDDKVTQLIKTCYLGGETVALSAAKQGIGENFFHCGLALTKHLIQKLAKSENNENEIRKLNRLTQILLVLSRNCPVALRPRKAEYRPNDPAVSNWILALIECAANSRKFELVDLVLQLLFDLIQVTQFLPADFFHSRQLVFCLIHSVGYILQFMTL
jgi:hypothetical protein